MNDRVLLHKLVVVKQFPMFRETECSPPCYQKLATLLYTKPDQSKPHPPSRDI